MSRRARGVLFLYHQWPRANAATVLEHVGAFARHSDFDVWTVNTANGFPSALDNYRFDAIALHYSIFGWHIYELSRRYRRFLLDSSDSFKICFFQDEHRWCKQRFAFIDHYGIDCVFSVMEESEFDKVYRKYTRVPTLVSCLTGYVSEELKKAAQTHYKPDAERSIDIGYRARKLDFYMGRGSQEKHLIAEEFVARTRHLGLRLDISTKEEDRLYGDDWAKFLSNCRGVLGVETGTSVFDLEDVVYPACQELLARRSDVSFEEVYERILEPWEDRVYYRTIGPRHFEAAAYGVCQILFKGRYSGLMTGALHYIELEKDFSNIDEVVEQFSDPRRRAEIAERARTDLIDSDKYGYDRLVADFDQVLTEVADLQPGHHSQAREIAAELDSGMWLGRQLAKGRVLLDNDFPGRPIALRVYKQVRKLLERLRPPT